MTIEEEVSEAMEQQGWTVLRNGWPDLLCYREHDGKPEVLAIECKDARTNDQLRPIQIKNHIFLNAAGLKVVIVKSASECGADLFGAASHSIEQHSQELLLKAHSQIPKLEQALENFYKSLDNKRRKLIAELDYTEDRYRQKVAIYTARLREIEQNLSALSAKANLPSTPEHTEVQE